MIPIPGEFGGPCATRHCDGVASARATSELDTRGADTPYRCADCADEMDDLARFEAEEIEWRRKIPFAVLACGGIVLAFAAVAVLAGLLALLVLLYG